MRPGASSDGENAAGPPNLQINIHRQRVRAAEAIVFAEQCREKRRSIREKLFNRIPRKISQYRGVMPLPSSVSPRGTSPDPHWAGFFVWRQASARAGRPHGYEILICFDRESVLKSMRDAAGHGVMNTPDPAG